MARSVCRSCGRHDGRLIDRKGIEGEFGVSRATADGIMQRCVKYTPDWQRKVYVRREEVEHVIASWEQGSSSFVIRRG